MTTFYGSHTISSQQIYPFNSIATTSKCTQSELPGRGWLGEITMTLWILSSSSLPSINLLSVHWVHVAASNYGKLEMKQVHHHVMQDSSRAF